MGRLLELAAPRQSPNNAAGRGSCINVASPTAPPQLPGPCQVPACSWLGPRAACTGAVSSPTRLLAYQRRPLRQNARLPYFGLCAPPVPLLPTSKDHIIVMCCSCAPLLPPYDCLALRALARACQALNRLCASEARAEGIGLGRHRLRDLLGGKLLAPTRFLLHPRCKPSKQAHQTRSKLANSPSVDTRIPFA